ncbi:hypothetical protein WCE10_21495, partial [Cronobacter muytjensii]|uniref:hypothetical protein n=1 Tax=Cronobacter muytjensii TaxID=413501 RepID=UPI0034D7161E
LVVRTAGITDGSNMGIQTGTRAAGGLAVTTSEFFGGFGPMGKIMGSLASAILGKVTKDITDSGLMFGGRVGDLQNGQGYSQYANVTTTKSRLFGLVKSSSNSTQTAALGGELAEQFGLVFKNLETVLRSSATALGRDADSIGAAVQNVVIDMT